jgi:hypothetical protein
MSSTIITQVVEKMNDLPDDLQQQILKFVITVRQAHIQPSANLRDLSKHYRQIRADI